ncbi:MAG: Ppx/GppA family phosphatase [Rubellimicrobium sp.]|nr:Ppx/GppA family phosphatase [Rubellimicrobium sp.]
MTAALETSGEDWGALARPLARDPLTHAMSRLGVIDVGSNSVRLVVFDGAARSPAYFYNEKIMCALGDGLAETGRLNPSGRARALDALERFAALGRGMGLPPLTAVATAAVREAEDGAAFCLDAWQRTGIVLHVIPGEEEARLSAQGVLLGWPGSYGLVCDMGGASMELAELARGEVGTRVSAPLGPLVLKQVAGGRKGLRAHVAGVVADLHARMGARTGQRLFLVGGSWRAIARIDMERRGWPLTVIHEYRMDQEAVAATRALIERADLAQLRARVNLSEGRLAGVPLAVQVLDELVQRFRPRDIAVSAYGIREGLLYEKMSPELRMADPLIESCHFAEMKDARLPGFGDVLHDFVRPLFPDAGWQYLRIIRAACLLHDVSWRAHPDYRAETCLDNVTRANLGGLKHKERVFLGLALMHRYSSRRSDPRNEPLFALLSPEARRQAEVLGRAMRLGAMLWLGAHDAPGRFVWQPGAGILELELEARARPLWGEVAAARFAALAAAMGATARLTIETRPA